MIMKGQYRKMENEMKTRKVEWVEVTEDEYYNTGIDGIERTSVEMGMGYTAQDYYADNGNVRIEPYGEQGDYYYINDDGEKILVIVWEYFYLSFNQWQEDEEYIGTLEEAMKRADEEAGYTQRDILIYGDENRENLIAYRRWYGVEYNPDEMPEQENPICFGKFGHYSEWNEID